MRLIVYISLFFLSQNVLCDIYDYIYPKSSPSFSNYGSVGLIQNPTSRLFEEGTLAISWTHNEPYLRGSIIAYPFEWLEASFQFTDINNELYSDIKEFSGSQSLKDKSFDFKVRILKESFNLPSVSIGVRDLGGTGLFASEYIVASKYINENIDFTFGIGWGALSNNKIGTNPLSIFSDGFNTRPQRFVGEGGKPDAKTLFSGDTGFFAGIEYYFPRAHGLRAKFEFDGTNYTKEGRRPINQEYKFNAGFVYPISDNLTIKLFGTRGNTLNFGFSYSQDLGSENPRKVRKKKLKKIENAEIIKKIASRSTLNLYRSTNRYLTEGDIFLQRADLQNDHLEVVYATPKYRNPALAIGRSLRLLDQISPDEIKSFTVSGKNGGLEIVSATIERDSLTRSINNNESIAIIKENLVLSSFNEANKEYAFQPKIKYPVYINSIGPDLQTQIGGPDGFFFGDLQLKLRSEILFTENLTLLTSLSATLTDNLDKLKLDSDSIIPHVRTDIVKYMKESDGSQIGRMQLSYFGKYRDSLYYKFSGGILERMFSGYGAEFLYKPLSSNLAIGFEAWQVQKRAFDGGFGLLDYRTVTGHLTAYYHEPRSHILLAVSGGRYLAKDSGVTFDFSRQFKSGLTVGSFFSLTDISAEEFGEGSFDKGFYFFIPLDILSDRYFKRNFGWGVTPLTRDGAQSLSHAFPLWGVTYNQNRHLIDRNLVNFYD
tara:strand:+ start:3565 stop:5700 length:2136 start_codon:yes stop_codon:yes gene_type:complete